ncbi:BZ3500_MvSof-1268-A1-R1_Chr1-3g01958 [Microbotryum saponariae]|uniref:Protein phosphatase n=1 Tax=Microbotryum saponariae TaxID=289078 RepID=A0A2X0ML90_9BASI|nr:BZ3500_MvSof-1268-A1-R1_Chr1-3g01958 [Microbotryum saponariae]SCZ95020.1 BZ3501_MvSof-1269-A2-R1_Chr1-3g01560 [Microbotryum saponariae]
MSKSRQSLSTLASSLQLASLARVNPAARQVQAAQRSAVAATSAVQNHTRQNHRHASNAAVYRVVRDVQGSCFVVKRHRRHASTESAAASASASSNRRATSALGGPQRPSAPIAASTSSLPPNDPSWLLSSPHHHVSASRTTLSSDGPSSSSSAPSTSASTSTSSSAPVAASSGAAALFSSDHARSFPHHALPSFFGTSLSIARRGNLVFRNGAYGIPKAGREKDLATKGKEKADGETGELDHYLSVSIGEDAYFLRTDSLGVADGVGGWSGHAGANPARWSRKLMHHCSNELARYENVDDELFLRYYEVDPVEVLQRAFEKSLAECKDEGVIGSSTALLAVLRNDELRLANMGDCCCCIIRGNDYIFRSEEQQHSFNFPFQAGTTSKDTPIKDAQRFNIKVQKDDIVILSSDGLMDNLYDEDILEEVLRFVALTPAPTASSSGSALPGVTGPRYTLNRFSPQAVSEALSLRAKSVYEDPRAVSSPFQQRAVEEGIHFVGGKRDDITTLIGVVGELEASPDRR